MSVIQIQLQAKDENAFSYTLCGQEVLANKKIDSLSAFLNCKTDYSTFQSTQDNFEQTTSKVIFKGESWLAEEHREVTCAKHDQGYLISVSEICDFFVSNEGNKIIQLPGAEPMPPFQQLEQVLLGPPFMLALALNQFFALHSSSVLIAEGAVLFTGDSGFGKSTLAQYLEQKSGFKRLSDDISVLSKSNNHYIVNTDFPQLKLSDKSQCEKFTNFGLNAIILLNRQQHEVDINLQKLVSFEAIEVLLNHGVATQLFNKDLANQHLKFVSELVSCVPIYSLTYSNGLEKINTIAKILKREFD